jgi:rod shape-determining protein MreC
LGRHLRLRYVLNEYKVVPGDRVVASGLDGVFPKGTLIGVVTAVQPGQTGLFQQVELEPSIDPNRVETVFIGKRPRVAVDAPANSPPPAKPVSKTQEKQ